MTAEPFSIKALYLFLCICRGSREMNLHQSTIGNYGNYGNYALIIARKCGLINMVIVVMDYHWLYHGYIIMTVKKAIFSFPLLLWTCCMTPGTSAIFLWSRIWFHINQYCVVQDPRFLIHSFIPSWPTLDRARSSVAAWALVGAGCKMDDERKHVG